MTNKIMILIGLMALQLPLAASNANANANAAAAAPTNSTSSIEADVKNGSSLDLRSDGLVPLGLKSAPNIVVYQKEKEEWCLRDCNLIRMLRLLKGPTERLMGALDSGALPRYAGTRDHSLLHMAIMEGVLGNIALLIERGADMNELDGFGNSPITIINWFHPCFARILRLLYMKGADMTDAGGKGISLHVYEISNFDAPNKQKLIELFIKPFVFGNPRFQSGEEKNKTKSSVEKIVEA